MSCWFGGSEAHAEPADVRRTASRSNTRSITGARISKRCPNGVPGPAFMARSNASISCWIDATGAESARAGITGPARAAEPAKSNVLRVRAVIRMELDLLEAASGLSHLASTPSRSHCGVQPLQLDAGVGRGEVPVSFGAGESHLEFPLHANRCLRDSSAM